MVQLDEETSRADEALALAQAAVDPTTDTRVLDELVRSAAAITGAGTGRVSMLVDQQVTASVEGEAAAVIGRGHEAPFEDTICANALRLDQTLVIPDTTVDDRVSSLPLVTDGLIGAYLGAPLRTPGGRMVGVLCVFDTHAREWTDRQVADVVDIAESVMVELERLRQEAA